MQIKYQEYFICTKLHIQSLDVIIYHYMTLNHKQFGSLSCNNTSKLKLCLFVHNSWYYKAFF